MGKEDGPRTSKPYSPESKESATPSNTCEHKRWDNLGGPTGDQIVRCPHSSYDTFARREGCEFWRIRLNKVLTLKVRIPSVRVWSFHNCTQTPCNNGWSSGLRDGPKTTRDDWSTVFRDATKLREHAFSHEGRKDFTSAG